MHLIQADHASRGEVCGLLACTSLLYRCALLSGRCLVDLGLGKLNAQTSYGVWLMFWMPTSASFSCNHDNISMLDVLVSQLCCRNGSNGLWFLPKIAFISARSQICPMLMLQDN